MNLSVVDNILELISNATSLPPFLYKKEMVIVSYENLNEIYRDLMTKTFLFVTFGILLPMYSLNSAYSYTTAFIARRKANKLKMENINFCDDEDSDDENYIPDLDNADESSDLSDCESNFTDSNVEIDEHDAQEASMMFNYEKELKRKISDEPNVNTKIYQYAKKQRNL